MSYQNCSYLYYLKIHMKRYICCYYLFTNEYSLFFPCFMLNCHGTFFLTNINSVILWYFQTIYFLTVKEILKIWFWSTTKSEGTKLLLPKPGEHWKTEKYQGSSESGEIDLESDIHHLELCNLTQYTTVPSQCDWLPWAWTCNLLYCDCWYFFKTPPGVSLSVTCNKLSLKQGAS